MRYGPLGRSGLIVSRICLGGNSWGAKGNRGWGKFDEVEAPAYFKRALDVGITFFDTADAYNAGRSEEIMGATLVKMTKREDFVLSTKVGIRMSKAENDVGTGRKHLMAAIDEQLRRLQTDYIDVYQVHRLDPHTPMEETMYTLDQIVRSGKVRYIGGSTMPAYKFAQMIMLADWKGYSRPIAMQNLYNLIQREEESEMNRLCHEQGVGLRGRHVALDRSASILNLSVNYWMIGATAPSSRQGPARQDTAARDGRPGEARLSRPAALRAGADPRGGRSRPIRDRRHRALHRRTERGAPAA
jgi:aryl-alcohol dehydrogenase-like predicted oxidoreductase